MILRTSSHDAGENVLNCSPMNFMSALRTSIYK